jgi:hypothetical protein
MVNGSKLVGQTSQFKFYLKFLSFNTRDAALSHPPERWYALKSYEYSLWKNTVAGAGIDFHYRSYAVLLGVTCD